MDGGNADIAGAIYLSSRPSLADKPLPFASSYRLITTWFSTVIFLQGTFTPLVHAHAGRTQKQPSDAKSARLLLTLGYPMRGVSFILKFVQSIVISTVLIFSTNILAGGKGLNSVIPVYEVVKWKSKSGVKDEDMIASVNAMVPDLKKLKGFLRQSLYKSSNGEWVDIYYWETEEDAHASNANMVNTASFKNLVGLIETDSVSIEVLHQIQSSEQ